MEQTGSQVGPYRLYERIGGGGFASVFVARDTRTNEMVAVKILHAHLAQDTQFIARFRREAEALQRMPPHPNIVRLREFGQQGSTYYLAMEYLEGKDLSQILTERKRLPVDEALSIAIQIAQALDMANRYGLVHRDIKPGNVKITPQGVVKVMDFGIARATEGTKLTQSGTFMGTPDYMAPEIWEGKPADIPSDIYALGALLYEMLTGASPFHSDTPAAIMRRHLMEQPRSVRAARADVPANLEAVISRMMAKQPEARYQTPAEVLSAIGTRQESPTFQMLPPAPLTKHPTMSNPIIMGGVIGALILFVLIAGVFGITLALSSNNPTRTQAPPLEAVANTPSLPTQSPPTAAIILVPSPAQPSATATIQATLTTLPAGGSGKFQCSDRLGCIDIGANDPIHIAYAFVTSGDNSTLGLDTKYGAELAIDDVGGKVLGHAIKFDGQDSGCSPEGGQAAATKIAADKTVVAVIGTNCSSAAAAAEPTLLTEAGLSMISPSNTSPTLTDPAKHVAGYFRTAHNDKVQGAVAAQFVSTQLKFKSAATVNDGSIYAQGLTAVFEQNFKQAGGTVTASEAVNVGDKDMKPVLTRIATGKPQLVYFPIFVAEGGFICSQIRDVPGMEHVVMMGADGIFSPDFLKACGKNSVGMFFSSPNFSAFGSGYQALVAKYLAKYNVKGTLAQFHAHAYDAMNMVLAALQKPGVVVKDADGTLHVQKQALRDAIAATDMQGITGHIKCDPNGDCGDPKIAIYQATADNFARLQMPVSPVWQP